MWTCAPHEGIWGSRGITPCILSLCIIWRWVVSFTPRPLCPRSLLAFWTLWSWKKSATFRWNCLNGSSLSIISSFRNFLLRVLLLLFYFLFLSFSFFSLAFISFGRKMIFPFLYNLILFSTRREIRIIPYFAVRPFGHSAPRLTRTVHLVSRLYTGTYTSRERAVSLKMISQALIVSETCGNLVSVQLFSIVRGTICASTFLIGFVGHAAWQLLA
jgi:hypothetical protein